MPWPPADVQIPSSYHDLPFQDIQISHYPESSSTPTPTVILRLNRPKAHHAFTGRMMEELEQAFQYFDLDDRVRCVVVTSSGKIFCAGADLSPTAGSFQGGKERVSDHRDGGGRVSLAIYNCRKPVIGALQGSAVGVGITMTLPMAIRLTHRDAKIGFVFARRGLIMEACSSFFLPKLIGLSRAMHLVTTGATFKANDRLLENLFSEVLDRSEDVLPRALEIANEITENTSVVSTHLMKELMWRNPDSPEGAHLLDSRIIYELFSTTDNKEGVKSFMEKRPVNFTGTLEKDGPVSYPWWEPVKTVRGPKAKGDKPSIGSKL